MQAFFLENTRNVWVPALVPVSTENSGISGRNAALIVRNNLILAMLPIVKLIQYFLFLLFFARKYQDF